jgi:hypothetical protein
MKKILRLTESDLTRLVKRVIKEEEENYDIAQTVIDTEAFTDEDIPEECKENPGMSKVDIITGCIGSITKKSTSLTSALTALTGLLDKAKSESSSMTESRRRRYRNY